MRVPAPPASSPRGRVRGRCCGSVSIVLQPRYTRPRSENSSPVHCVLPRLGSPVPGRPRDGHRRPLARGPALPSRRTPRRLAPRTLRRRDAAGGYPPRVRRLRGPRGRRVQRAPAGDDLPGRGARVSDLLACAWDGGAARRAGDLRGEPLPGREPPRPRGILARGVRAGSPACLSCSSCCPRRSCCSRMLPLSWRTIARCPREAGRAAGARRSSRGPRCSPCSSFPSFRRRRSGRKTGSRASSGPRSGTRRRRERISRSGESS